MRHHKSLKTIKLEASFVTIGSFDGIHLGHRAIIKDLVGSAQKAGVPSVVLTFFPHPSVVLRGRTPTFYIMSPEEKAEALFQLEVDYVVTETFTSDLARIEADPFLTMLENALNMKRLFAGDNFTFGYGRQGDRTFLEEQSALRSFEYQLVPPVQIDGEIVSSSRVREALRAGDVVRVSRYLDRYFEIPGFVSKGVGRGKQLGFPTANLSIWDQRAFPSPGVYACWSDLEGEHLPSVVNIGHRPTFMDAVDGPIIEAHILDFDRDIYGSKLKLSFVQRLRDERKFENPAALLNQIESDIKTARQILSAVG